MKTAQRGSAQASDLTLGRRGPDRVLNHRLRQATWFLFPAHGTDENTGKISRSPAPLAPGETAAAWGTPPNSFPKIPHLSTALPIN